jgi:hypothetical protein
MSSSFIRSRRTTSNRVSLDSGGSNASQELIHELKEEFRRSLVNTHRASSARNLRPSEILAEKERLGRALDKVNSGRIGGGDGGDGWDDGVECVGDIGDKGGKDSEDVSDSTEWGGFGVYDFLSGQSSDEEEDAEDAALLLNMPVEDSAGIKYVFKKQQGCVLETFAGHPDARLYALTLARSLALKTKVVSTQGILGVDSDFFRIVSAHRGGDRAHPVGWHVGWPPALENLLLLGLLPAVLPRRQGSHVSFGQIG